MKTVDSHLSDALLYNNSVNAVPKLIVEWNLNRYIDTTCENDNTTELNNAFDPDMFPISSIVLPQRASKQHAKLLLNEGIVSDANYPSLARYYSCSVDDVYKYWISQDATDGSGNFPTVGGQTNTKPYVVYTTPAFSNKITIRVQNNWATPSTTRIYVRLTSGTTWTLVSTTPTIDFNGETNIYLQSGGTWSTTPATTTPINIWGIKYEVDNMTLGKDINGNNTIYNKVVNGSITNTSPNGSNSHLHLIEIAAKRIEDMSSRVMTTSNKLELSDESPVAPIGTLTSNELDVVLHNYDGELNVDDPTSSYNGILHKGAKVNLSYVYTINGQTYEVPDAEMYSTSWITADDRSCALTCVDESEYLQSVDCPQMLYQNLTLPQIVVRILDSVGFTNHNINLFIGGLTIPIFWSDGTKSVWEVLDALATSSQTAIYFDSFGILNVKTREAAFVDTATTYQFYGQKEGNVLANIITLNEGQIAGSNKITVNYAKTEFGVNNYKAAVSEVVWQPDGDLVLRSTPLAKPLAPSDDHLWVSTSVGKSWPLTSLIQIESELISTYGKEYKYKDASGNWQWAKVTTIDQQQKLDNVSPPVWRGLNGYNGKLFIGTADGSPARGLENTGDSTTGLGVDHSVTPKKYIVKDRVSGTTTTSKWQLLNTLNGQSQIQMATNWSNQANVKVSVPNIGTTGSPVAIPLASYCGTRITFVKDSSKTTQSAGITTNHSTTNQNGYYIELTATLALSSTEIQKKEKELTIYKRLGDVITKIADVSFAVDYNTPINLDVKFSGTTTSNQYITVWTNGVARLKKHIDPAIAFVMGGTFGVYAKGSTTANFDYLYGQNQNSADSRLALPSDSFGIYDLINGGVDLTGFASLFIHGRTDKYRKVKHKVVSRLHQNTIFYYDEFGAQLHEVRDFDIKFDPAPVQYSHIFTSNQHQAVCTDYNATPFGAKFRMMNDSRSDAVLQGTVDSGTNNEAVAIIGRSLAIADSATEIGTNDEAIRRDGEINVDFTSDWIQSDEMALAIVDWMKTHWSSGVETVDLDVFGNPLVELGDMVSIKYDNRGYDDSVDRYFVTSIQNDFDAGLSTALTLRKRYGTD